MVQVVCQRCGEKNEGGNLNEAKFKLVHGQGCGSGIGITVPTTGLTEMKPKPVETPKAEETAKPAEPRPSKTKKKSKPKKSSDESGAEVTAP